MNAFVRTIAAALFAIVSFCVSAQTATTPAAVDSPELTAKKAAAKELLSKKSLTVNLKGRNSVSGKMFDSDFEAFPTKGTFMFWGSTDRCENQEIRTDYSINDQGNIVMVFTWPFAGCSNVQFRFDPLTKIGGAYFKDDQGVFVERKSNRVITIK